MNIGVFTRYGHLGASSRVRFHQYLRTLESHGINLVLMPLFDDAYVTSIQIGRPSIISVFTALFKRSKQLILSHKFDALWIEKDCLPWVPSIVELTLLSKRIPIIVDYDDAVFHQYDLNKNYFVRLLLGDKHKQLMRKANIVVAGNSYIADYARNSSAKRVEILPTVVDLFKYNSFRKKKSQSHKPVIGWIGQKSTAPFLNQIKSLIDKLQTNDVAQFVAVGISGSNFGLNIKSIEWREDTEVESISNFDIGIMPLVDQAFERGKCGYKLIQYMACGLPVVASPVGVNVTIVDHGVNGFLASTEEEWEYYLRKLIADPDLRRRMGEAGREKIEQEYSLQVTSSRLLGYFNDVIGVRET